MIEIKELDMHLEDNTLVHNTKGHEKREEHRWKGKSAAYVEELFEYVWKVADHFMPAHVEPWEEGEEPSDAPVTFARRYQRDVGRVNHTMQQGEEVGYDAFYGVGHIHLVAVELYLVFLQVDVALYLGEIEHAREVEGVVYVEVYPEQRLVAHGVEVAVELLVVFVGDVFLVLMFVYVRILRTFAADMATAVFKTFW